MKCHFLKSWGEYVRKHIDAMGAESGSILTTYTFSSGGEETYTSEPSVTSLTRQLREVSFTKSLRNYVYNNKIITKAMRTTVGAIYTSRNLNTTNRYEIDVI